MSSYEAQAQEWIASLPPGLSFDALVEEDDVCRFVLRGHAINLFEMIYWPFCQHISMAEVWTPFHLGYMPI